MKSPCEYFWAIGKQNIVLHFPLVKRGLKAVNLPHLQAADSRHRADGILLGLLHAAVAEIRGGVKPANVMHQG